MSSPSEKRAAQRRATWQGGVARSFAEADDLDLAFWRASTIEQRVTGMTQLVLEMSTIAGEDAPPRLQRSVGGVRPRRG